MLTGLYIHVPFCLKKCKYCDFISYPYRQEDVSAYLEGLMREMEIRASSPPVQGRKINTVYIGGGTPTCLPAAYLEKIVQSCFKYFNTEDGAEITVEANPGTVNDYLLSCLINLGVNRLSLGVQSCREDELLLLGRIHSFRQAEESFLLAREAGFKNIGVDLIFGIPGQSTESWLMCLESILSLEPEHISAYGLQIEVGTPLYRDVRRGEIKPCGEEEELEMFEQATRVLTGHGFEHYEISNYALPGKRCRHNLIYWHNQEYLGLGPAAHSYLEGFRYANEKELDAYLKALNRGDLPVALKEEIDRETEMAETVFLGLRLIEGLDLDRFYRRFGCSLQDIYSEQLSRLIEYGLVEIKENHLRLTRRGLPVANQVFMEFL